MRHRIYLLNCQDSPLFYGKIEADESNFDAKRVRTKRRRGAGGKVKVFGLSKRDGKIYTEIIPNVSSKILTKHN